MLANLTGVLLRFHKFGIATLADIEGMFIQVSIKAEDRSSLRFLWNRNNVMRRYQFSTLIFGARHFVLSTFDRNVPKTTSRIFSLLLNPSKHDYIHSTTSRNDAIESAFQIKAALQQGGFRLTKFESNSTKVLNGLPASKKETPNQQLEF